MVRIRPNGSCSCMSIGAAALAILAGCGRSPSESTRYQNYTGQVTGRWVETGRMALIVKSAWAGSAGPERKLDGFITSDSEVYLNDRVVSLGELSVGDSIRVIGYFEPGQAEDFWVALAYAEREAPDPPPIDFFAATQPASSPTSQEIQHVSDGVDARKD